MKRLLFFVMITCWAAPLVAQQLYSGIGIGFKKTTTGVIFRNTVEMELTNGRDAHYLVPYTGILADLGNRWYAEGSLQYQPGSLSVTVRDIPDTACVLCSVRKGTLVSYGEFMFSLQGGIDLIDKGSWTLRTSTGFYWNHRISVKQSPTSGLTNLSREAIELLGQANALVAGSCWNLGFAARLSWRKWTLSYQYFFNLDDGWRADQVFPDNFRWDQSVQIACLQFQWLSF